MTKTILYFGAAVLLSGFVTFKSATAQVLSQGNTAITQSDISSSSMILKVQERMAMLGYPVMLSGELDPATRNALRQFQNTNGIFPPSGQIDMDTLRALQITQP